MPTESKMFYFAVFLALLGNTWCQQDAGTSSGSCAVTESSLGCANYRVLSMESKTSNFLRMSPNGSITGFIPDLLNALKATMPFNFTLSIQADDVYGAADAKGQWNGMVGQLVHNTTDMVIADLTITSQRLAVIDFTTPFMPYHMVIVSQPNASLTDMKYAVKASSGAFGYLKGSRDARARPIWASVQANRPTSLVRESDDGLALVRQGGWAFFTPDAAVAVAVKNSKGSLVINHPALHTSYYALGVQRGSPLQLPLSTAVMKTMDTGRIQQLLSKWDLAA